jgi:hypothetical protein
VGITVQYRRISQDMLTFLQKEQHQGIAEAYMLHERTPFPYSLYHFELGKTYDAMHVFLNPDDDKTHILWDVLEGAKPLFANRPGNQIYLGQIYVLTSQQIDQIVEAMMSISAEESIERYKRIQEIAEEQDLTTNEYSKYLHFMHSFEQFLCFFRIAHEAGDAVLRWHT